MSHSRVARLRQAQMIFDEAMRAINGLRVQIAVGEGPLNTPCLNGGEGTVAFHDMEVMEVIAPAAEDTPAGYLKKIGADVYERTDQNGAEVLRFDFGETSDDWTLLINRRCEFATLVRGVDVVLNCFLSELQDELTSFFDA